MARIRIDTGWRWTCDIDGCDATAETAAGCPPTWRYVPADNAGGPATRTACPDHVAPLDAHSAVRASWRVSAGDDPDGYASSSPMPDPPWSTP